MKPKEYLIVLGDVIASSSRDGVQHILHTAVKSTNEKLSADIIAPFEITRGDEVAFVTHLQADWFSSILIFIDMSAGVHLRWVVTVGYLTEGLDSKSSAEMIGPGFIAADTAMKKLKKTGLFFSFQSPGGTFDDEITGIINLYLTMLNKLTPLQRQVLRLYQRLGTQNAVADVLKKSQQQVQQTLHAINWHSIDLAEKAIITMLKRIRVERAET